MYRRTSVLLAVLLFCLSTGNAQSVQSQSGYAIITLQGSTDSALTAVETLLNVTAFGTARTDLAPSQLLTSAVLPVNVGPPTVPGTNLVLVNPSPSPATVNLVVTNASGVEILNRTIMILEGEQLFQSVNALFVNPPDSTVESRGLLTITSNVGIAMQAVEFPDVGFTFVPITVLAGSIPVPLATNAPLETPTQLQTPFQPASVLPPTTIGIAPPLTTRFGTFMVFVTPPLTSAQLQPPVTIGGTSSLIFPLVRTGDGSATTFTIGNTTTFPLAFRIDLFDSSGDLITSLANITVPPQGLVVFSSESPGVLVQ